MRITAVLLLTACLSASAGSRAQKVSLKLQDAPLSEAFSKLETQTGFYFVYGADLLSNVKKVSIDLKDVPLSDALNVLLKNTSLTYTYKDKLIILSSSDRQHSNTAGITSSSLLKDTLIDVKGRVVNEKREPVEGVSVRVKSTNNGTSTNANGEFVLNKVPEDGLLIFSAVNIENIEWKVSGKTEMTVSVKTRIIQEQEVEVLSTGYQQIPKERTTGSFSFIDNKLLNQQTGTNILKRLDGITSGVLFDNNKLIKGQIQNDNISIRGLSTINASTSVLVVLDGFIYEGDINNINPNDIDNITILKDASAASIWGARAGNGVIVLTSKKGKFNQKAQVGVNINTIASQKPDLFYLAQMNSGDYIDVEQFLFDKGFFDSRIDLPYIALTPAVEIMLDKRKGLITDAIASERLNALRSIDSRDQYLQYVYRNPVTQQYAVNVRGGSNAHSYTFSAAFDKTNGELRNQSQKLNLKMDNVYRPLKNVEVNVGVYYTNSKAVSGSPGFNSLVTNDRQLPYLRLADDDGNPLDVAVALRTSYTDTVGGGKLLSWKFNPLENYKHDVTTTRLQEMYAIAGLQYRFAPFLTLAVNYQHQRQQSVATRVSDLESFTARHTINMFTQLDRGTGQINYIVPMGGIVNSNIQSTESHTARAQANFSKTWQDHSVTVLAGSEIREAKNGTDLGSTYGYSEDPLTFTTVDQVNPYPQYITGSYGYIPSRAYYSRTVNRFVSVYANGSYTFRGKYSISASARRDGSNIFGLSSNDKWRPLWSAGAGWKISDESFFSRNILSSLRLRMTYGYSGNVDLSKTAEAVAGYTGPALVTNFPAALIFALNNPSLRWEKSGMFNIGVDFAVKNDQISGSIEYYRKKSTDLYAPTPYDYTTWGFSPVITKNVAEIKGYGVDVMITSKNIDRQLKWSTTLLFNYNTDKTTKYEELSGSRIQSKLGSGTLIIPVVGKPLYAIAAYKWGGLDNAGNPQGFVDGKKSTDYEAIFLEGRDKGLDGNIVYIGPSKPPVFGSVINNISWKGFSLGFNISYRFGYYFQRSSIFYNSLVESGTGHADYAARWQKPGDELRTSVPSFVYPADGQRDAFYGTSEALIAKADHIRLQYINLSYMVHNVPGKKSLFREITVYANVANLGLIWKANDFGLDPEFPNSVYPPKSLTIGVRANF